MNNTLILFEEAAQQEGVMEYGSYLLYDYNATNVNLYVYANASSPASMQVYGAAALEATASYLTGQSISLQFNNVPLPKNTIAFQSADPDLISGLSSTGLYVFIGLNIIVSTSYLTYFSSGYYS